MRVLFCITRSDTIGGAHVHVADLAQWLIRGGHEVAVLAGGAGPYREEIVARGVPYMQSRRLCRSIQPHTDLAATLEIRSIVREFQPDVLALHSAKAGLIGRVAARGLGIPIIYTAHGWPFTEGASSRAARLYEWIERSAAPLADRIIAVSEYDRKLAISSGVASPEKVVTIRNGIPDSRLRANAGANSAPVRITMVARLDAQKDHATLFAALGGMIEANWALDLVGDGPDEGSLRRQCAELGISERVSFLGLRRDVATILAASHLFVLTSNWEGLPLSILEAMRAGLPVIATDVGGVSEVVVTGETGYLVPRRDVQRVSGHLRGLVSNPAERLRLGLSGRQRFETAFRFDSMAEETLALYQRVLQARRAGMR